jgi:hypothetical protein
MTNVRLAHIGGPTTVIEVDSWRLLTDPTLRQVGGARQRAAPTNVLSQGGERGAQLF